MRYSACLLALMAAPLPALAENLFVEDVRGYTLEPHGRLRRFEAMLVMEGKVAAIGSAAELKPRAAGAKRLAGGGRVLLPGLIDAHGHVMGLGFMKRQLDLSGTASLAEAQQALAAYAKAHAGDRWLQGRGWNQVIWKLGRFPTTAELDGIVADKPVWLRRVDGHAGWANGAALKLAGITEKTPDPAGGRIERDTQGRPSGVLVDAAMDLVEKIIPAPGPAEQEAALDAALKEMASLGLTSVHDAGIDAPTFELYRRYAQAGRLSARLYAMIGGVDRDFERISRAGLVDGDFLMVRSVKLYSDGALGSRGAALLAPYSDAPGQSGLLFADAKAMSAQIGKALAKGYQVNVHAIGDRGNRVVLDGFAAAFAAQGGQDRRNRIEHAQVVAPEDIPRFKALGLIASMQPTHATSDMNMAEARVGAERMRGAYAWQHFLKQGTPIAGGSDFPVESANPFYGLHAAVTRQDHGGQPKGGWYAGEAMSREQALRAFTLDAAYAAGQEKRLGSLAPGYWADFILVDRDPFADAAGELWRTRVQETWVAGKRVFSRP
ncbi:MAG: amidohydrolase [Gammaproteobacteria bacterium]|nr:amidohydrolase [Gammaproteobacteria bacterium]